jgi:uncharacterized repeat protein (TIGR01451 family)
MSQRVDGRFLAAVLLAGAALFSAHVGAEGPAELRVSARKAARIPVLIELTAEPAARVYGRTLGDAKVGRAQARAAAQERIETIVRAQDELANALQARFGARVGYRVQRALNAIAVDVDPTRLDEIRRMPGVKAVHLLELEYPTGSTSVPFLGVPQLWEDSLGVGRALTGDGIRIGIIDTGIDYQHANFGGSGLLADYQANDRTSIADGLFPTGKVVGGTDFVGDGYTGSNSPVPDPDPMDCNGHGTHVAGIATGFGVNADGTRYAGPYDGSAPFGTMRIGPGAAPEASLYALRVFGCTGGTTVTVEAIDWAIDPNDDGDFSDHLDVINMSLGSAFGGPATTTALASENAALAGVIVVASAGNSGDTYFIGGSPGSAAHAISVAATADGGVPGAVLQINSPAAIAGNYLAAASVFTPTPPPPAGQTADIVLAQDATAPASDACTALTNSALMAGKIALIDRGGCNYNVKVQNAQAAGAIGAIVVNNVPGDPALTAMPGSWITITIPSVFISQADGSAIKAQLASGVNATLAAASAGDMLASFSSRGPRPAGAPIALKPDLAAPGLAITSAQSGVTCTSGSCQTPDASGFLPNNQALVLSGTSMAAPHMAGSMALLRQYHPDWTVEELKALAMNTSVSNATLGSGGSGQRYGPGRVGAGRTHPTEAATTDVVAYNAEEAGLVSVSFDGEVLGTVTRTRKVRVVNKGTTGETYDLAIDTATDAPGVWFSLPGGSSVTVPPGGSVELDVQMDANAAQMRHAREGTVATFQSPPTPPGIGGTFARHWLTEEAGYLTFSQSGSLKKRVPLYAAVRPASDMAGAANISTGGAPTGSTTIPLSGTGVCTGTLSGSTCSGTFPTDEVSLVSPFELQVVSPLDPANGPAFADIQYAGVAWTGTTVLFGVSTWANWSTPTDVAFNILVDTNSDGNWDRILFNTNPGTLDAALFGNGSATGLDAFQNAVYNITAPSAGVVTLLGAVNRLGPTSFDSALFDNHVMFLAATPAQLNIPPSTSFKYKIVTCPGSQPLCGQFGGQYDSAPGPYFWDRAAQGLNFSGMSLLQDQAGASIPVAWNTANMALNGTLGALLLHHHNLPGTAAQVVMVDSTQSADVAITNTDGQTSAVPGQGVTYSIVATNAGPNDVVGATVVDSLPAALTGVSWTCAGSGGGGCTPSGSGSVNTVVNLPAAGSVTFTVTATVSPSATGSLVNTATVILPIGVSDPSLANNSATDTDPLAPTADLSITKSDGQTSAVPGLPLTYTIVVANAGPSTVAGAAVSDALPAALTGASWACAGSAGSACGSAAGSGSIGSTVSLPPGGSATYTVTGTVSPTATGTLSNTATVTPPAGVTDPTPGNNSATDSDTLVPTADLSITKTDGQTMAAPGQVVTYTIVVANAGPSTATGARVTDSMPAVLTGGSWSCAGTGGGACGPTSGSGDLSTTVNLPPGGSVTYTVIGTVSLSATGTLVNTASVTEPGGATDPTAGNNSATDTDALVPMADLSITKTDGQVTVVPGQALTYTIQVTNAGPSAVNGATVSDTLPDGLSLVGWSCVASPGGYCGTPAGDWGLGEVSATVGLPPGGVATLTVAAKVSRIAPSHVVNTATVAAPAGVTELNAANNAASDDDVVGCAPSGPLVAPRPCPR